MRPKAYTDSNGNKGSNHKYYSESHQKLAKEQRNLSRMKGSGKSTLDNGYGLFFNMLEYKLADRGRFFIKVAKWFPSSQICNCCETVHTKMKDLSLRTMCCGFVLAKQRWLKQEVRKLVAEYFTIQIQSS